MLYIKEIIVVLVLAVIVAGNLGDVFYDYREGASIGHILMELSIAIVSFALITVLIVGIWRQSRSNTRLKAELASVSEVNQRTLNTSQYSEEELKKLTIREIHTAAQTAMMNSRTPPRESDT